MTVDDYELIHVVGKGASATVGLFIALMRPQPLAWTAKLFDHDRFCTTDISKGSENCLRNQHLTISSNALQHLLPACPHANTNSYKTDSAACLRKAHA